MVKEKIYKVKFWNKKYNDETSDAIAPEIVKITENTLESYLKNIKCLGYKYYEVDVIEGGRFSQDELNKLMNNKAVQKSESELRFEAQQKEIDELKALLKDSKKEVKPIDEELEKAKTDYKNIIGKKPHHTWDEETIRLKITEFEENK